MEATFPDNVQFSFLACLLTLSDFFAILLFLLTFYTDLFMHIINYTYQARKKKIICARKNLTC